MADKGYSAKDVRVLKEFEHIRLNPGMYIGSTERPTHLIEEALDNALDEAQAGFASIIAVKINTKDNICSVIDNGRGIPIRNDTPTTISSKLFSGAKFHDKKSAYEIASGLHGVGLCAVNALSDTYVIEIYRNKQYAKFDFINGKLKKKSIIKHDGDKPFSTKIEFSPSKKIFEKLEPDISRIRSRLTTASAEMGDKLTFVLDVNDSREIIKLSLVDHFKQNCLNSLDKPLSKILLIRTSSVPESFNVMLTYSFSGSVTPRLLSSVNLLPVDGGGTHANIFFDLLKEFFISKAKKMGFNFQPQDSLVGLRAYLMLSLKEPKFSGQTKDKLTNVKTTFEKFTGQIKQQIELFFNKNPSLLEEVLENFQNYRIKLDSKKMQPKTNGKRASTKFTKLRECTSRFGELFIAEGESAAGGLVDCRDTTRHAILPLKGKIPSAATTKDILKNKEIGELIGALGTGIGPNFNIDNLKYSKVICATDADDDGKHIFSLLTLALAILVPEVIKNGFYYYAKTPLYAINEKNVFIPLWTSDELINAKNEKRTITRFKGLGELSPNQLKVILIDDTRQLVPVTFTEDIDKMSKLFSDSSEKRKLLKGEWSL